MENQLEESKFNLDRRTVSKILAHVEKNCVEVAEVEEYLWNLLDDSSQ
ncbi:hypothetical protein [Bacillus infantis]|nr:hypothetical protein [Bacillus infantis]